MTSNQSHVAGGFGFVAEWADGLLYTRSRSLAGSGTAVAVCDPHGVWTESTSTGLLRSLMSKTWTPSQPAGTASPSHVSPAPKSPGVPAGVFHERTTMLSHTSTSPWFPAQLVNEICWGSPGEEMSRMLNPTHVPWIASFPQKAMSVWMFVFPISGLMRLAGSWICPSG